MAIYDKLQIDSREELQDYAEKTGLLAMLQDGTYQYR